VYENKETINFPLTFSGPVRTLRTQFRATPCNGISWEDVENKDAAKMRARKFAVNGPASSRHTRAAGMAALRFIAAQHAPFNGISWECIENTGDEAGEELVTGQ